MYITCHQFTLFGLAPQRAICRPPVHPGGYIRSYKHRMQMVVYILIKENGAFVRMNINMECGVFDVVL